MSYIYGNKQNKKQTRKQSLSHSNSTVSFGDKNKALYKQISYQEPKKQLKINIPQSRYDIKIRSITPSLEYPKKTHYSPMHLFDTPKNKKLFKSKTTSDLNQQRLKTSKSQGKIEPTNLSKQSISQKSDIISKEYQLKTSTSSTSKTERQTHSPRILQTSQSVNLIVDKQPGCQTILQKINKFNATYLKFTRLTAELIPVKKQYQQKIKGLQNDILNETLNVEQIKNSVKIYHESQQLHSNHKLKKTNKSQKIQNDIMAIQKEIIQIEEETSEILQQNSKVLSDIRENEAQITKFIDIAKYKKLHYLQKLKSKGQEREKLKNNEHNLEVLKQKFSYHMMVRKSIVGNVTRMEQSAIFTQNK